MPHLYGKACGGFCCSMSIFFVFFSQRLGSRLQSRNGQTRVEKNRTLGDHHRSSRFESIAVVFPPSSSLEGYLSYTCSAATWYDLSASHEYYVHHSRIYPWLRPMCLALTFSCFFCDAGIRTHDREDENCARYLLVSPM